MVREPSMAYWLAITSRGNWKNVRTLKRWAVSLQHESLLKRASPGDSCIAYVTSDGGRYPSAVNAAFGIAGPVHTLEPGNRRNLFDQMYPCQTEITITIDLDKPVPFYSYVSSLSFIRKPHAWGAYLQGFPMRRLSGDDYDRLHSALLAAGR